MGYAIVGLAAYMAYPTTIQSNVLNTFAASDPIMQLARFVVAVLEIASYPVNHFPARAAIKDFLHSCTGWQFGGKGFVVAETLIFFLVTLGLALVVHDLGAVFSLVGGTCGSIIILGLPGALLVSYSVQKHRASRTHGEEAGSLATPLLYDTGANGHYNAWSSKHFWGGMALVISCTLLFGFTVVSSLFSSK